jgi:DNA-binding transcriptional ArsR family regulator
MARAATTTDAFNAVAEPRRRQILAALAGGQRSVSELVAVLDMSQPLVSKHLRVLREVGIVTAREDGRQRLYRLNGSALKPIYDWVKDFEQLWSERFARMDIVLAELKESELKEMDPKETEYGDGADDDDELGRGHTPH